MDNSGSSPVAEDSNYNMIDIGFVDLNRISDYLVDLPVEAKAKFLVSPKSVTGLFNFRTLYHLEEGMRAVALINESEGLHYNGQRLKGMEFGCSGRVYQSYEQRLAKKVREAWEKAQNSGQAVTTPLFIGTLQLIGGFSFCKDGALSNAIVVRNNLFSCSGEINAEIANRGKGGEQIATSYDFTKPYTNRQHVCNDSFLRREQEGYYIALEHSNVVSVERGGRAVSSTRPIALHVLSPNL